MMFSKGKRTNAYHFLFSVAIDRDSVRSTNSLSTETWRNAPRNKRKELVTKLSAGLHERLKN